MAADNYLRPQSDTRLAQQQNYLITLMQQVRAAAVNQKSVLDQIAIQGVGETDLQRWERVAAEMGYTGVNATDNVQAAYNLLGSVISVNLASFYEQMLGRMG